jgi:hypothetical protein
MIANGWPESVALEVMERTLRIRVAQLKAGENSKEAADEGSEG